MRVRERRRPDGHQGRRQRHRTARVLSTPAHGEAGALHGRPFRAKICQAACRAILGSALHGPQVSDTLPEPPNGPSRWGLPSSRSTFNVHQPGGLSPSRYATRGDPSCAWRMAGATVSRRSLAVSPMVGRTHCLHGGAGLDCHPSRVWLRGVSRKGHGRRLTASGDRDERPPLRRIGTSPPCPQQLWRRCVGMVHKH
jgi:hypothetical protein